MTVIPQQPDRILLVDDAGGQLGRLAAAVEGALDGGGVEVIPRRPAPYEGRARALRRVRRGGDAADGDRLRPDQDGPAGFFDASVGAWCQRRAIPVGDHCRGNKRNALKQPNLFEFRSPSSAIDPAAELVAMHRGFSDLRARLDVESNLLSEPTPANMLVAALDRPGLATHFSLHTPQIAANPGFPDLFRQPQVDRGAALSGGPRAGPPAVQLRPPAARPHPRPGDALRLPRDGRKGISGRRPAVRPRGLRGTLPRARTAGLEGRR